MPLQILTLKLDSITAGDYLTWCQDPDPPALDFNLQAISIDADPLGDAVTAILDWTESPPPASIAATAAGLPLAAGVQIHALLTESSHATWPARARASNSASERGAPPVSSRTSRLDDSDVATEVLEPVDGRRV